MSTLNLYDRIPTEGLSDLDDALEVFLDWVSDRGLELYPAQEEAVLELFAGQHVMLKTPTGSGKSLVAIAMHFRELCLGNRSVYTAPIKALVSEKFLALCETFGPDQVGMMTGDGAVNRDALIVCCTAEVLTKLALRHADETGFEGVVMDEFHYYGDRDRGMAWQVPLLLMPSTRFLLMSATLGDTSTISDDLEARTGVEVREVVSTTRPVPLEFEYSETPLDQKMALLVRGGDAPVYAVHFTQRAAAELAQSLMSTNFCTKQEKAAIRAGLAGLRFDSPYGSTVRRYLEHGVGLHHAGLLPKYRMAVEKLSQRAMFKVICGTDTLGVGINVPIRSVLFTQLCKFDGEEVRILSVRDFKQIAGRAGRKGFDDKGRVVVQAPSWVIENSRLAEKIDSGKKKRGKVVKKKPPERGYKHWDQNIFDQLVNRAPEPLESSFRVDHGLVLTMLQKGDETLTDAVDELRSLVESSHATRADKQQMLVDIDDKLEALVAADVIVDHGEEMVPRYTVHAELQDDFSMHHQLSLFLLHGLELLDREHPEYPYDVVTLVESILEHPRAVLYAQVSKAKGIAVAEMKAAGVEYEERMERLEEVTWPKPRAEWIYQVFNEYKEVRPWLDDSPIRPKSIVREMVTVQASFSQFVKELGLERIEGVLLRYVHQVYKTLLQNVPESYQTPEVVDILAYLRAMLARVDDSLLKTWESLRSDKVEVEVAEGPVDISADLRSFRARIRAELYALLHALASQDYEEAAASLCPDDPERLDAGDLETMLAPYLEEHGRVIADARIRQGWTTVIEQREHHLWWVRQVLVEEDPDDQAWSIDGWVDLREDSNPHGPLLRIRQIAE